MAGHNVESSDAESDMPEHLEEHTACEKRIAEQSERADRTRWVRIGIPVCYPAVTCIDRGNVLPQQSANIDEVPAQIHRVVMNQNCEHPSILDVRIPSRDPRRPDIDRCREISGHSANS